MQQDVMPEVYQELGVRRVVNAFGHGTVLGGSMLNPTVRAAMEDANRTFVSMDELLDKAGRVIAGILGAEAVFLTSGCFASLTLSAAGIMTGTDRERIARLPDTTGLKNEFLIQTRMRYHYDRCPTVPGGTLREVGDAHGTTAAQLAAAIGPRTAGVLYLIQVEGAEGTLSLDEVMAITRDRGIVVMVDAAWQVYPLERMRDVARKSDLACFSTKYMGGPNSVGFLCGRKALVEAASLHGFAAYETKDTQSFGRGYKVDRQEVIGAVVAIREWFALNHQARLKAEEQRIQTIVDALSGLPHVQTELLSRGPWRHLRVMLDEAALGKTAASVEEILQAGDPSIRVRAAEDNTVLMAVHTLNEGEEHLVAQRLKEALSG